MKRRSVFVSWQRRYFYSGIAQSEPQDSTDYILCFLVARMHTNGQTKKHTHKQIPHEQNYFERLAVYIFVETMAAPGSD